MSRMKIRQALVVVAAMLGFVAANLHAQTIGLAESGSSALWLELGQASANAAGCFWTAKKGVIAAQDTRVAGNPLENGNVWVTWNPGSTGTCATPSSDSLVNVGINIDSVLGQRCFFASPRCKLDVAGTPGSGANLLPGFTDNPGTLPSSVQSAIAAGSINAAATDIRPEDGKLASLRMFTPCGTPVVAGSQYLGLGYQTGTTGVGTSIVQSALGGGTSTSFHVFDFNLMGADPITGNALPGNYTVIPVGAAPMVFFVNPSDEAGFGSLLVSNLTRATLAGYLDGTYGRTQDAIPQVASGSTGATVFLREPLSGTYNTTEYGIPNEVEIKSSQDLGVAAVNANGGTAGTIVPAAYCNGAVWNSAMNPLAETYTSLGRSVTGNANAGRFRAVGSGNEVAAVLANPDSLGYAFWSAANFANATASSGKYLTVDGVDPIQENWTDGLIPTSGNELLGNVTLAHVRDGSYPVWSILRLVTDPSGPNFTAATNLAAAAAKFLSSSQPDFIPVSQLTIVRSHFSPPGVSYPCASPGTATTPANGGRGTGSNPECGGDVGGLVYSLQADTDYITDSGVSGGNTGRRQ